MFLAAFGHAPDKDKGGSFSICLAGYDGARVEIYGRDGESYFSPVTLDSRPLPGIIPSEVPVAGGEGAFYVQDVYQGLLEQGVVRGQDEVFQYVV